MISQGVTSIGANAFCDCTELESVLIPDSVISIGRGAFGRCKKLQKIDISPDNPVFDTIDGVLFSKDHTKIYCYLNGLSATAYTVPSGVTNLMDSAFYYANQLKTITLPDTIENIGDNAFIGCKGLTEMRLPESVTEIGWQAFAE